MPVEFGRAIARHVTRRHRHRRHPGRAAGVGDIHRVFGKNHRIIVGERDGAAAQPARGGGDGFRRRLVGQPVKLARLADVPVLTEAAAQIAASRAEGKDAGARIENGSAVSSRSDPRRNRCCGRKWSAPSGRDVLAHKAEPRWPACSLHSRGHSLADDSAVGQRFPPAGRIIGLGRRSLVFQIVVLQSGPLESAATSPVRSGPIHPFFRATSNCSLTVLISAIAGSSGPRGRPRWKPPRRSGRDPVAGGGDFFQRMKHADLKKQIGQFTGFDGVKARVLKRRHPRAAPGLRNHVGAGGRIVPAQPRNLPFRSRSVTNTPCHSLRYGRPAAGAAPEPPPSAAVTDSRRATPGSTSPPLAAVSAGAGCGPPGFDFSANRTATP